jgi:hypothetical protein
MPRAKLSYCVIPLSVVERLLVKNTAVSTAIAVSFSLPISAVSALLKCTVLLVMIDLFQNYDYPDYFRHLPYGVSPEYFG